MQLDELRADQMQSRGFQQLLCTLRRWREMKLQRAWRSWLTASLHSEVDALRADTHRRILRRTMQRWRAMQLQQGWRTWTSVVFRSKVLLLSVFSLTL